MQVQTPHPPSLGYRHRSGTLSHKGRGEAWMPYASRTIHDLPVDR